ncbi:MAG: amino acid--tRNA ligase-related protein, partial [Clostridia bacterium]|nr:amino acid--tRNA ligase-related protein [Clostridia bacterium]
MKMQEPIEHLGEFYQLDMEMAFSTQEDVFEVMEEVIYNTFNEFTNKTIIKPPFQRISYNEAMLKYGSDKPDLRNPLIIQDVTEVFKNIEFNAFRGKTVKAIVLPNATEVPRKFYDGMVDFAVSDCEAKGLAWVKFNQDKTLQGSIAKFINENSKQELLNKIQANPGDSIFFISDKKGIVENIAGQIRNELANRLDLLEKNTFKFCWIVDYPMFELDDEGKIEFSHNPFSMPQGGAEALNTKNPLEILAYQYDLVCNGVELSSGAVRNHDPEIMIKAFNIAGYSKETIETKFPALFNAFHYGAPPHAGMAPGV